MNHFKLQKIGNQILKYGFILYVIYLIRRVLASYIFSKYEWSGFELSDWLINYRGGFVRRGFIGEILYWVYQVTGINTYWLIMAISMTSLLLLAVLVVYLFIKKGYSCFILCTCLFFGAFAMYGAFWFRRDSLILLLTFGCFYLYRNYVRNKKTLPLIRLYILIIITLLLHEASFFFIVPFILIHYFLDKKNQFSIIKSVLKTILFGIPIFICLFLIAHFKGNQATAQTIWDSWQSLFLSHPRGSVGVIGKGVDALTWTTSYAANFHIHKNFYGIILNIIPFPIVWMITFILIYYLMIGLNRIDTKLYKLKPVDNIQLSNSIIFQFVMLLPMFSILSCDFQRVILYWLFSSVFIYSLFGESLSSYAPKWFNRLSTSTTRIATQNRIFRSTIFYLIIALFIGITNVSCNFPAIRTNSIIGQLKYFCKTDMHIKI